jgi:hypothetical protein
MKTLVRLHLTKKRRNSSEDLGVHELEMIPNPGEELLVSHGGILIRTLVVAVIFQGIPDLDGFLMALAYLTEL